MEINEGPNSYENRTSHNLVLKLEVPGTDSHRGPKGGPKKGPKEPKKPRISETSFTAQPGRLQEVGITRTNSPPSFMVEQLLSSPGSLPQGLTQEESDKQMERNVDKAPDTVMMGAAFRKHER